MKKKFLIVFITICTLIMAMGIINASAETSGTCGANLTWVLDDEGTLTISGTGDMTSWSNYSSAPWYSKRTSVKSVIIGEDVTSIEDYAFYSCSGLTSVTIPDSVTSIEGYAFYKCSGLTSVTIGESVISIGDSAFSNCTRLTSITIPDSVTSIGSSAFYGCTYLTEIKWNAKNVSDFSSGNNVFYNAGKSGNGITVVFGENVEKIPAYVFYPTSSSGYSPKIISVTIGDGVTSIGSYAFYNCSDLTSITIPDSVTSIGSYAFYNCSGLTSVTIGDGVTSIGSYAFYDCSGITSITIPDSVTSIGSNAFYYCSGLTSITIPDSVTSIGSNAFSYCSGLTSVTIRDGVTSIGSYAFSGCSGITSVTIGDSVISIGSNAFSGCSGLTSVYITDLAGWCGIKFYDNYANPLYYANKLYLNNELMTELVIPDSVTSIGDRAFNNCSGLTSVTIGDGVTSIGSNAFSSCGGITSITIGDSVTSIGDNAFSFCRGITSITIGDSVTSIGSYAFSGCSGLTSVTIGDSVTSIGYSAFFDCSGLEEISLPFVGSSRSANGTGDALFGYIFGYDSNPSTSLKNISQYYLGNNGKDYTIPTGLKKVIITDAEIISYGAFSNCSMLTSITIPDSVTSIGERAFYNCEYLTEIKWNAKNVSDFSSGNEVFYNAGQSGNGIDVVFGENVKKIPAYVFYPTSSSGYSPKIISVTIGDGVTSIGSNAFSYCSGITSITIPDSVTSIGSNAFSYCSGLTSVTIGESVISIGDSAFSNCTRLTSITIPDSVTSIGSYAFSYCSGLEEISLPFVGSSRSANGTGDALFGYIFGGIGNSVTQYYSSSLSITYAIPTGLKKVTITDAEIIPYGAFYDCINIEEIAINAEVTMIYPKAFYSCDLLLDLILPMQNVKIANSNVVSDCEMLTIYGLADSDVETFANKYGIDFEVIDESNTSELEIIAEVINGKIVVTVKTSVPVITKFMPVGLYKDDGTLIDVMIIPTYEEFETMKVVFKDNNEVSYAKVFLCDTIEDLTPLVNAPKCEIIRQDK